MLRFLLVREVNAKKKSKPDFRLLPIVAHEVRDVGKGSGALTLGVIQLARVVGLCR